MGALGHYLEDEGIATTQISLVREHTAAINPPRALWVPFMLGRPLGAPNNAAFQREVLREVLRLFDAASGPVLRDFPHEAPGAAPDGAEQEGDACPVNFGRAPRSSGEHALAGALVEEIAQLRPWHDLAVLRRGGTSAGLAGMTPERSAEVLLYYLDGHDPANAGEGRSIAEALKFACDNLRAFYEEAVSAQPGALSPDAIEQWFYLQTVAGEVIHEVRRSALAGGDATLRVLADLLLLPRSIVHRPEA